MPCYHVFMANIRYLEKVGSSIHIHHVDATTLIAVPDGRGRWLPRTGGTPPVDPPTGEWTHPLPNSDVTSPYGPRGLDGFHYGHDWATPGAGGTVYAPTAMVITKASDDPMIPGYGDSGAGTHVKAHTLDGLYTFAFYHMVFGSLTVSAGQTVPVDTALGTEGDTGNVTGRHLHFEVYEGNYPDPWVGASNPNPIDPAPFLIARGITP